MSQKTLEQYNSELDKCKTIFVKKTKDYGTAWRVMRPPSLTDQLLIKARRIRSIEEKGAQKIEEGVGSEYIGLVNYSLLALVQLQLQEELPLSMENIYMQADEAIKLYEKYAVSTRDLMLAKNHDYGEAWRDMRRSSLTDLILMKIFRIKQIEDNQGKTLISEGLDAGYQDIINYAIFALIKLSEK